MKIEKWMTACESTENALYFKTEFNKPNEEVFLDISALGWLKVFMNGKALFEEEYLFGWRDYNKSVGLKTVNITPYLQNKNELVIVLGNGWACSRVGWGAYKKYYHLDSPCLFTQLTAIDDGKEYIIDNANWYYSEGPIKQNDIYDGELQDLRECSDAFSPSIQEWKRPKWIERSIVAVEEPVLVSCHERLTGKEIYRKDNKIGFDFLQNLSGFVELKICAKSDCTITVRHAEILKNDRELAFENLRTAKATDVYLISNGIHILRPHFSYHGFRYCEIGVDGDAEIVEATSVAVYADLKQEGDFSTSNSLLNQLHQNICWSMKSNFSKIPTDCPQRDERFGWLGDIGVFAKTAMYNYDCEEYLSNYLSVIAESISDAGEIPCIAPYAPGFLDNAMGASGWADAFISLIYEHYQMYGDKLIIEKYYPLMEKYIQWIEKNSSQYKRNTYCFSDWLSIGADYKEGYGDVDFTVFDSCFYSMSCLYLSQLADAIGKNGTKYLQKHKKAKAFFLENLYKDGKIVGGGTQTALLLAYKAKFLEGDSVINKLVEDIEQNGMTCGFLGVKYLLPVLSELGRSDVAYCLICNKEYPSWGYSIVNGATTLWERWDSYTKQNGINAHGMNSFNHFAFGSCGEWFYESVLGIQNLDCEWREVKIAPKIDFTGKVDFAKGGYAIKGKTIFVEWSIIDSKAKKAQVRIRHSNLGTIYYDLSDYLVETRDIEKDYVQFTLSVKDNLEHITI